MREIVFCGKRTDNGEWVEGWYIHTKRHHCIITGCIDDGYVVYGHYASDVAMYVVDPVTVGQYTGLKDKNGKRIFEGDIVDILTENEEIGVVEYEDGGFLVSADGFCVDFHANINGTDLEIIGNIHDNGELMEVR